MSLYSAVKDLLGTSQDRICAKLHIKRRMRDGLGQRILPTITVMVQGIKRQIRFLSIVSGAVLCLSADQSGLGDFPKPQKSSEKKGIIYARVSSNEQANEGHSLNEQVGSLTRLADDLDIEVFDEPIKDEGETGTDFDRDGIQKVFRIAQRDSIDFLLCQNVDRIGRSAAETLYFLHVLQTECEVKLVTSSGEQDLETIEGLMHTTLMSLLSEVSNEIRTSKSKKTQISRFVEEKQWHTIYPTVPVGYTKTEDGWLKIDPDEGDVVDEVFDDFLDCETYAETKRRIQNKHGSVLEGHRVKTLLQQEAYVGKPQVPEEWLVDTDGDGIVVDDELKIVDEETFGRAQRLINKKDQIHSVDDETKTIIDFVEEFDLFTVIQSSKPAKLQCPDCAHEMVKNGQRDLKGALKTHQYLCPDCGHNRKWPHEDEYDRMEVVYEILNESSELLKFLK